MHQSLYDRVSVWETMTKVRIGLTLDDTKLTRKTNYRRQQVIFVMESPHGSQHRGLKVA